MRIFAIANHTFFVNAHKKREATEEGTALGSVWFRVLRLKVYDWRLYFAITGRGFFFFFHPPKEYSKVTLSDNLPD